MTRRFFVGLLGLVACGLAACSSPPAASPNVSAPVSERERVQAALKAQAGGPMVNAKYLLLKSSWACTENCSGVSTMSFSDDRTLGSDLIVNVNRAGNNFKLPVQVAGGYQFSISAPSRAFPCRFIIDGQFQCDVDNATTGMTDHAVFKGQ